MLHKAFILGAGLGTRLRPLTNHLPKPLIPYYHRPLIDKSLEHCLSAGIDRFAVNTHHQAEQWSIAFPENKFAHAQIDFFYEPKLLETGGGIKNISDWIEDDPILVYNGDILTNLNLEKLIQQHNNSEDLATLALFANGPNTNVAVFNERVIDIRNAKNVHPGTHQFSGIYIIEPEILTLIPPNQKISIIEAFLILAEQKKLGAHVVQNACWQDLGTREEYIKAHLNPLSFEANPAIHPSAQIDPTAMIDKESCFIGPDCVIEKNVKLRNTIVWPAARVEENANLSGCIVRDYAEGTHHNKDF